MSEDSISVRQKDSLSGRGLLIFITTALSMLRIGIWAADWIILFFMYGRERVLREHLKIVRFKPLMVVSNGDVLAYGGFVHYLISAVLWMFLCILLLSLAWKFLPKLYHEAMEQGMDSGWSIMAAIVLFFALNALPLKLALALAALVLAAVFLTIRTSLPQSGQT